MKAVVLAMAAVALTLIATQTGLAHAFVARQIRATAKAPTRAGRRFGR